MEREKVIEKGFLWRAKDGRQIQVWEHKWLKKPPDFKVQHPDQVRPTPLTIDKLMVQNRREWNMPMIKEMMTETDATLVIEIPLSRKSNLDRLIWKDSFT